MTMLQNGWNIMYTTNHKKYLIDLFEQNKDKVFSAIYLVDNLKDIMNKATVYRQLKSLEEENIIRKTYNEETCCFEYQYSCECNNHLHLRCVKCGKIIHLKCVDANTFINHIYNEHDFLIDQYQTSILGICKECQKLC